MTKVEAKTVKNTRAKTRQGFVVAVTIAGATVYTDDATAYLEINHDHESVKHPVGEYVHGQAHTNEMESFWATLMWAHKGTYHKINPKHLHRHVSDFAGRHNVRGLDTLSQMSCISYAMRGEQLTYAGLVSGAV